MLPVTLQYLVLLISSTGPQITPTHVAYIYLHIQMPTAKTQSFTLLYMLHFVIDRTDVLFFVSPNMVTLPVLGGECAPIVISYTSLRDTRHFVQEYLVTVW